MAANNPHISVCVCTYKRPALLDRLMNEVTRQETGGRFTFSVVVVDNDADRSAKDVADKWALRAKVELMYDCEPARNIAAARNRTLNRAHGEFIAFIDDDEFPVPDWLARLVQTCDQHQAAGVLGPVRPHFDQPPPEWIVRGRFCERPEYATGTVMHWRQCRTGNVLFRRRILPDDDPPFDERFANGGEDVDFFMRMDALGHRFLWCNEAIAYETVPASRMKAGYMLRRALLRGRNSLKITEGRWLLVLKSLVAVPGYSLILPFAWFLGHHKLMYYSIRLCDHAGRVLGLLGLSPVKER